MISLSSSFANKDKCNSPSSISNSTYDVRHQRLGHPTFIVVIQVLSSCNIPFTFNKTSVSMCTTNGKSCRLPFHPSSTIYSKTFKLNVLDLWGPSSTLSSDGFNIMSLLLTLLHGLHGYTFLKQRQNNTPPSYTSKHKSNFSFSSKILTFQSDWGVPKSSHLLWSKLYYLQTSCPNTSDQNGIVERGIFNCCSSQ